MENKKIFTFSRAIEPLPSASEKIISGKDYVLWGSKNNYPEYIHSLYERSTVFQALVSGISDYVAGADITNGGQTMNRKDQTMNDILKYIAFDYTLYGGFALQVIYNKLNQIAEIYSLDFRKVRTNQDMTKFYLSKDWTRAKDIIEYPAFGTTNVGSVIFYFNGHSRDTYPIPSWSAATRAIETSAEISNFHYNNIKNRFAPDLIFNFNNGAPADDVKEDIERRIKDKFTGTDNSGSFLISWNESAETATTIERISDDNSDEKYATLRSDTYKEIFIAFKAQPQLFGFTIEGSLFNKQEYAEAYQLFYATNIQPKQKEIERQMTKLFDTPLTIKPMVVYEEDKINPEEL